MNVNELIGKYKKSKLYSLHGVVRIENVIKDLEQLRTIEYSRKVKVPQFIADWLEQCKGFDEGCQAYDQDNAITLQNAIDIDTYGVTECVEEWLGRDGNDELFAKAWLDNDYEIEQDPKYYVVNSKGKYFCNMGFSIKHNFISNVIWQRDSKFEFKTKEAAEAVILLVGGKVEEHNV